MMEPIQQLLDPLVQLAPKDHRAHKVPLVQTRLWLGQLELQDPLGLKDPLAMTVQTAL